MSTHKIGRNTKKCERYLNNRTRIKNKTRTLNKRVKNMSEEDKKKYLEHNKIGRQREKV